MNFFNKTKYIEVPVLGKLLGKKDSVFGKFYSWIGSAKVLNGKETFIGLIGDENYPNSIQVELVVDIISNFNTHYKSQVNYWLGVEKLNSDSRFRDWENTFFVGMITASENDRVFDVTLEPINEDNSNYLFIEIENKKIISLKT